MPARRIRPPDGAGGAHATDMIRRLGQPPREMPSADQWLAQLLAEWESDHTEAKIPDFDQLRTLDAIARSNGRLHIVDTATEDPGGYCFRFWGSAITLNRSANLQSKCLAEIPLPCIVEACKQDYAGVVLSGMAAYDLVHARVRQQDHIYARLLLPLARNGMRVDRLLVAVKPRPIPELLQHGREIAAPGARMIATASRRPARDGGATSGSEPAA